MKRWYPGNAKYPPQGAYWLMCDGDDPYVVNLNNDNGEVLADNWAFSPYGTSGDDRDEKNFSGCILVGPIPAPDWRWLVCAYIEEEGAE